MGENPVESTFIFHNSTATNQSQIILTGCCHLPVITHNARRLWLMVQVLLYTARYCARMIPAEGRLHERELQVKLKAARGRLRRAYRDLSIPYCTRARVCSIAIGDKTHCNIKLKLIEPYSPQTRIPRFMTYDSICLVLKVSRPSGVAPMRKAPGPGKGTSDGRKGKRAEGEGGVGGVWDGGDQLSFSK
jgi:hypothetical protein